MISLEYRLLDEKKGFSVVTFYENISKEEVILRFNCDYFIKNHKVYRKETCRIEGLVYVIYVEQDKDEKVLEQGLIPTPTWQGTRVEVRHFQENTSQYPVIHIYHFHTYTDVLLFLNSDTVDIEGNDWCKTATEVDENRKVYVYYAEPIL
ncbi:hypothetical protein IC620_07490 [Hazenella sp. IB182357]|uniref:Uncharacterized protein n=1 Tax=Polycladospora coralii TaxID=2771432 RepID=A0A926NAS8_9BACL|nr:hypothetical protein [Polycladospora coralii]MBD1372205.1 hypothetical protein [Polycladospora coralii]MBS7530704.1 hypothetical protein [Polycladospora coralii]